MDGVIAGLEFNPPDPDDSDYDPESDADHLEEPEEKAAPVAVPDDKPIGK